MALLWLGRLSAVLLAAPARADVHDDNPAAASRGPGDIVVLARGADAATYERHLVGGAWTSWASIGGRASSGPAAAAFGDAIHAFVTGTDGAVYENVLRYGAWSGWRSLGGVSTSAPAAGARRATSYLDIAIRGSDNGIYFRTYQPGAGWFQWFALGGNLTSAPALNSQDPGVVNTWHRGTDGQLVQKAWTGTAWRDFEFQGGVLTGAPSVINRQENMVDVFVRGSDRSLFQKHWQGGQGWGPWWHIDPKPLDSTPVAVSDTPGHVLLFARSGAELQYKEWHAASGWGAWTGWGPVAPPPPPAPPTPRRPGDARRGRALHAAGRAPARDAPDPAAARDRAAARAQGRVLRQARPAPGRPAGAVGAPPADAVPGGHEGPRLRARHVHAQGIAQAAPQDRLAPLRDVPLSLAPG